MEEKNTNEVVSSNTVEPTASTPVTEAQPVQAAEPVVATEPVEQPVQATEQVVASESVEQPIEVTTQPVAETPTVTVEPVTAETTQQPSVQPIEIEPVQVEQVTSENNNNKPKKGNKLVIILLVLIALGAIGYIVYDKVIAADKPNNEVNENEDANNNNTDNNIEDNTNDNVDNNTNNNGDTSNNTNNNITYTEGNCLDGNGCKFSIGSFNFDVVNIENGSLTGQTLYINGNKVLEDNRIIFIEENFLVLNDIVVVHIGEGLDHFTKFNIYDKQGKLLLDGSVIDTKFGNNMILDTLSDERPTMYLEGNKIKINASRFTHGPGIIGETGTNGNMINQNTSCDTIVMGTYEIEYYGNGSLSEIRNTGYITLRDAINNHGYDYSNYVTCN